ncbi:hypothetical protein D3C71_1985590 [compost metagenome]
MDGSVTNGIPDTNTSFSGMNVNDPKGSTQSFIAQSKDYLNFIGIVISFLPAWITVPINTMLVLLVIVTVKKAIWG